jgi:opacity protein-like surface antigen
MRFQIKAALAPVIFALGLPGTAALAQDVGSDWSGQLTIYGWVPGIKGAQTRPDGDPLIDLDGSDVLDALEGAFFGTAEIRRGRTGLILDMTYADLGQDGVAAGTIIPGAEPATASADTTFRMGTAAVTYRALETEAQAIDVYGGFRHYDVDADFSFSIPTIGFETSLGTSAAWTDAIVGARGKFRVANDWTVTALTDFGGFGIGNSSELSWQVLATLDYAFTEQILGRVGYRYMSIDKTSSGLLDLDLELGGPLIGVTWTF